MKPTVTDFSNLKTLEDFQRLFDTDPAGHEKCRLWLQTELNTALNVEKPTDTTTIDRYFDLCEKALAVNGYSSTPEKALERKESFKSQRWTANEQLIARELHIFTQANRRTPTALEIAKATGLSRTTVHRHLVESDYTTTHKQEK